MATDLTPEAALKLASIEILSAGCKSLADPSDPTHYTLPRADIYVDCRGVANPAHGGPSGSGDSPEVQAWVTANTSVDPYFRIILETLTRIPTRRGSDPWSKPVRILCFCAHGIHRSRAMKHILARRLTLWGGKVKVIE